MTKVIAIVLFLIAAATVAVLKYFTGSIVVWNEAYQALEAGEVAYPSRGRDGERVRLANAMAESEAPPGMPTDRRIHPVGTLAHLRYETLGRDGSVTATTEVRALVPSLPFFGVDAPAAPFGLTSCPRRCQEGLAESGAMEIARGGSPGLSPEWVLRMPAGKPFDVGMQSYNLQDLEDPRPLSLPHARYRVTLLEACPARVRVGAVTSLEFHSRAIVPIPSGFRTQRWVQLDDCPALAKKRPARPEKVAAAPATSGATPPYAYKPPKLELLIPRRGAVGRASLVVDEGVMLVRKETMHVVFRHICRYDAASNRWEPLPMPEAGLEISGPPLMNVERVAYRFPEAPGLYWAEWSEMPASDRGGARSFALVIAGGTSRHCREGELPSPAPGEISICVPQHGPAEPKAVPDPAANCSAQAAVAR